MMAQTQKNLFTVCLSRVHSCWLLPGPAEDLLRLPDGVALFACSRQVWRCLQPPCFYGRTLSCGYGYQDRRYSRETAPCTHTPFQQPETSTGSLGQPLILGLWVYELILDSDGDHFLFSPLFDRTPMSRYIDCCSLAKNQGILGGRQHVVGAKICDVSSKAGWYNKPVQYGRESTHKRKAAGGNATLDDCMQREQQPSGRRRISSAGPGRSQQLCTLPSQTVKGSFCNCANILMTPTFCWREYFVDTNILSTRVFCRRQHFVDANILLPPIMPVDPKISVAANILSLPIFFIVFRLRMII